MSDKYIRIVEKVWGEERWIRNDKLYCMKELILKQGYRCSLHYHKKKTETFYVLHGRVALEWPLGVQTEYFPGCVELSHDELRFGERRTIEPGMVHRFCAFSHTAMILECSTQHFENDSYRMEPSGPVPVVE